MNTLIGQNIRLIAEWGQLLTAILAMLGLLGIYLATRRFRFFVPRTLGSWAICIVLLPLVLLASLVCARITYVKPQVTAILNRFDALENHPAPPLHFQEVATDRAGSLSDYQGQVVLINLWATWCAPCRVEMPELDRLQRSLANRGLVVLAISDEERGVLIAYQDENPGSYVTARVSKFEWVDMGSERPVTFLVDRQGVVREIFTGPWDEAFFRDQVERYL